MATGDNLHSLAYAFRVGHSTVAEIVVEISIAIMNVLQDEFLCNPTLAVWKEISEDFYQTWNFPNCVGAIDGKHIAIQAPANSGSDFINYKGFHSLILLAVCDAKYRFTIYDLGAYGREGDAKVYGSSSLAKSLENGKLGLPSCTKLPFSQEVVPYFIVGDGAFPMKPYLLRPYTGRKQATLSPRENIFNYRYISSIAKS